MARKRAKTSPLVWLLGGLAAMFLVALVGLLVIVFGGSDKSRRYLPPAPAVSKPTPRQPVRPAPPPVRRADSSPIPKRLRDDEPTRVRPAPPGFRPPSADESPRRTDIDPLVDAMPVEPVVDSPTIEPESSETLKLPDFAQPKKPDAAAAPNVTPAAETDEPDAMPAEPDAPETPMPAAEPEPAADESPNPFDPPPEKPAPKTPPPDKPDTPATPTETAAPKAEPTADEIASLAKALQDARTALNSQKFDAATAALDKVRSLPMQPEHEAKYERLCLLTEYARNFQKALHEATGTLESGEEIPLGDNTAVGVVNAVPGRLTVRVAGANRTYTPDTLPAGLAIAIADKWLKMDDPASLLMKAAYLATLKDAEADRRAKAREWFREGGRRGTDAGLEQVLDDTYNLQPAAKP